MEQPHLLRIKYKYKASLVSKSRGGLVLSEETKKILEQIEKTEEQVMASLENRLKDMSAVSKETLETIKQAIKQPLNLKEDMIQLLEEKVLQFKQMNEQLKKSKNKRN